MTQRAKQRLLIIFLLAGLTVACGGGGGSNSDASTTRPQPPMRQPEKPTKPTKTLVPQPQQPLTAKQSTDALRGTPSTELNARLALAKAKESGGILHRLDNRQANSNCYYDLFIGACENFRGTNSFTQTGNTVATADTQAHKAWEKGWTGKGVKVAVVDDYRQRNFRGIPHGYSTRGVVAQVAPEAEFYAHQLDLPSNDDSLLVAAYDEAQKRGAHIVNISFGPNPFSKSGGPPRLTPAHVTARMNRRSFQKIMQPAANNDSYHPNMLFVHAAGNQSVACVSYLSSQNTIGVVSISAKPENGPLGKCDTPAAALLQLRKSEKDAGDRAIFVGALHDDRKNAGLADYSLRAGELKNDYIVAHDNIWTDGDARGTSFAAPRVTGAAALVRHKWPNLTGPHLKQVLLLSATDLGEKGVDEVFGHGKLNIIGALSPIGGLTR